MTKDGLADKAQSVLRKAYDKVLSEPIPDDMKALLERLK